MGRRDAVLQSLVACTLLIIGWGFHTILSDIFQGKVGTLLDPI